MAQIPYELLIRWDPVTGALRGAHVKLYDDVLRKEGEAQSVAVANAQGFPLDAVMSQAQISAVAALDVAQVELAAERTKTVRFETELDTERSARASEVSAANALRAEIATLRAKGAPRG